MKSWVWGLLWSGVSAWAQIAATEVVDLPSAAAWGGADPLGSALVGYTYNAGEGPGIWIVADGGYRLYHNGALIARDNQAGRVSFVPLTFLPGENAISVVGIDGNGAPGVLVQIDELDQSHVSHGGWKVASSVSDNSWKNKGYNDGAWALATAKGNASTLPSGSALSGFAAGSSAQWIWASNSTASQVVLRYKFNIQAEGFGALTTGGAAGELVVATDSSSIVAALQSNTAQTILVPEGTYDLRAFRNAVTEANQKGRTWCKRPCGSGDANASNTHYRINFEANSCASLNDGSVPVQESENLMSWSRWITTKPNKSLIGMGRGANLRGASIFMRSNEGSQNLIFRNLAIYDVNPHLVEGGDGLSAVGTSSNYTSKLWIDHVSYKWISDGLDVEYTQQATISWLDYDGANEFNCWATDPYMALIQDAEMTYANVYWRNTFGRVPKASSKTGVTKVHMYNNYLDYNRYFIVGASGSNSSARAEVLYENNYVNRAQSRFTDKGSYGFIRWIGNTTANSTAKYYDNGSASTTAPSDNVFTPSYTYTKRSVANLPTEIPLHAGVGGRFNAMPSYNQAFGRANQAPQVALTAPSPNATATAPASWTLSATASDVDGSVSKVDFYLGNTWVGSDATAPYSFVVSQVPQGKYSVVAVATDNSGLRKVSDYVTITVEGASNTAPKFTMASSNISVVENSGKFVTQVTASDAESGTLAYSLSGGDDQDHFLINGSTGNLWMVRIPDYESPRDADGNNQYKVRVRVTDPEGLYADLSLNVQIVNENEAPQTLALSAQTVEGGLESGTLVGVLSGSDPDASSELTYSLASGGLHNQWFAVEGNELRTASTLEYGALNEYQVLLRVEDEAGLFLEKDFVITVTESSPSLSRLTDRSRGDWQRHAVRFVVYDLAGRPQSFSAHIPWQLPAGQWVVRALDSQGRVLHSWVAQINQ